MNYLCPFGAVVCCDRACRFYSDEPQKQSQDPDGPGSCVIAQYLRIQIRETHDREQERLENAEYRNVVSGSLKRLSAKFIGC